MKVSPCAASAVQSTAPAEIGVSLGAFLFALMYVLYVTPYRKVSLIFVRGSRIIESVRKKKLPPEVREYFVKMGREGGKKGGVARASNMTDEQRSESARNAVNARWKKAKEEQ